ncbi:hypothetical protein OS493_035707 [Desmophyllum pertusum]|uniref:Uncharacterized protein n=1 Tax=Desmophyllum pertusum TaxID=174260 RepID=A0A9W9YLN2_9CNID|nr:hypothetical protein OS493_035707 [Desmophyllum pertusum]
MESPSTRPVTSQSTSRGLITSVSRQEEPVSSGSHFATTTMAETTATPGGLSKTQTARNSFSSIISLQRTVARVSPTETILPSFQTKGSKGSLFVTPVAGHTSTMKLSVQENGPFSGTSTTKTSSIFKGLSSVSSFQGESLPTSTETVVFPMTPTTTPIGELNTSYNIPDLSKTIDLTQSNIFTRIKSVSASIVSTFLPIVQKRPPRYP